MRDPHPIVAALLVTTVLLATAGKATAKPLDELEQLIAAYEVTLTGDPAEDEQRIVEATDQLERIVEVAEALDDKHLARGVLRALEAYLILADALLVAPCPETLGPDACAVYRSMLAEKAAVLARTAMALATSLHSSGEVRGADRTRFEDLTRRGSSTVAQAVMMIIEAPTSTAGADRFALVWGNAELYRSIDDPAPLRAYDYDDGGRLQIPDAMHMVQVIGDVEAGGLVEVSLGGDVEWDRHCVGNNPMPHWATIRAWVDPADMVPVLAAEVGVEYEDGTGVRLMPGTPRVGDQAWLEGQLVPIPGGAAWTTTYPGDVARLEGAPASAHFSWDISGTIGGQPFDVRQPGFQYGDWFYVDDWAAGDDGGLITQSHRCGEVRFRVGQDVVPGEAEGALGVLGMQAEGDWVAIPAGAALYWNDGTDAGVASRDHSVEAERLSGESMRCVEVAIVPALRGMTAHAVSLCAPAEAWVTP